MTAIPMVDLAAQHQRLRSEIEREIAAAVASTRFIQGPQVAALETEVARYCGVRHAIGCASGTDALHLALRAAGIGPGDEVITTAFTFIATAEAISHVGATPVFVDIDPATFNIDPEAVARAIGPSTRAVLPVHLYGHPADLDTLESLCRDHDLLLIEDCAQSFGATHHGRQTGSRGLAGCFSFFPAKNLGCYGDGGMITTNSDILAERIRLLANHGSRERYHHECIGYNSRLDEIQAAVLRVKLRHIDELNEQRRENAARYRQALREAPLQLPDERGEVRHVWHQYTLRSNRRDAIRVALTEAGIASAIHYPIPLHKQQAYAALTPVPHLPQAERAALEVLSLPMYPELSGDQVERVTDTIRRCLSTA